MPASLPASEAPVFAAPTVFASCQTGRAPISIRAGFDANKTKNYRNVNIQQSINKAFLRWLAPGFFSGTTMSDWLRILRENDFSIDTPYLSRAAVISLLSVGNSVGRSMEQVFHERAIANATVQPPLFVLGCWRSGTTHLHNLLSKDERFAFPSTYQVMNPHIFLTNEWWNAPLQNLFYPQSRMMDNVRMTTSQPQEDEFAIATTCGMSPMMALSFWRNRDLYNSFTAMKDASAEDIQSWKDSLDHFFRKLTVKYGKPLVLKSPAHTARIKLLLEMYPESRFVLVHRHPYEVFVSAVHMYAKNLEIMTLQRFNPKRMGCEIVNHFQTLFDAYFEQRSLVPSDRLVEISFEELDQNPLRTIETVYETLNLPDYSVAQPAIAAYVDSLSSYEKNSHHEIEPIFKEKVLKQWGRCFDEWGYDR